MDNMQLTASVDVLVLYPPDDSACGRAARFVRRVLGADCADVLAYLGLEAGE